LHRAIGERWIESTGARQPHAALTGPIRRAPSRECFRAVAPRRQHRRDLGLSEVERRDVGETLLLRRRSEGVYLPPPVRLTGRIVFLAGDHVAAREGATGFCIEAAAAGKLQLYILQARAGRVEFRVHVHVRGIAMAVVRSDFEVQAADGSGAFGAASMNVLFVLLKKLYSVQHLLLLLHQLTDDVLQGGHLLGTVAAFLGGVGPRLRRARARGYLRATPVPLGSCCGHPLLAEALNERRQGFVQRPVSVVLKLRLAPCGSLLHNLKGAAVHRRPRRGSLAVYAIRSCVLGDCGVVAALRQAKAVDFDVD